MHEVTQDPADQHRVMVRKCIEHGATVADIAALAKLGTQSLKSIMAGRRSVSVRSSEKLDYATTLWLEMHPRPVKPDTPERREALAQHLRDLQELGTNLTHLAEMVGISLRTMQKLKRCEPVELGARAWETLESLPCDQRRRVASSVGAVRRMRGLVTWGYGGADLAREFNMTRQSIEQILRGDTSHLTLDDFMVIGERFPRLELVRGPSLAARARGEREGWPTPFRWDEATIDLAQAKCWKSRGTRQVTEDPETLQQRAWQELNELAETAFGFALTGQPVAA